MMALTKSVIVLELLVLNYFSFMTKIFFLLIYQQKIRQYVYSLFKQNYIKSLKLRKIIYNIHFLKYCQIYYEMNLCCT